MVLRRMDQLANKYRKPVLLILSAVPAFFLTSLFIFGCAENSSPNSELLSAERLEQFEFDLQAQLDEWREDERITGATISVYNPATGNVDLASGHSKLSIDPERSPDTPLEIDTPMFVSDIGHLLIAASVVELANENVLDLEQSIQHWFPHIENSAQITVRNLLEHTSGIPVFYTEEFLDVLYEQSPTFSRSPDEVIAVAAAEGSFFPPGSQYGYSKTNYIVLGRIIELTTQRSLESELRKRFLDPLELTDTYLAGRENIPGGIPLGYEYAGPTSDAPTAIDGHVPQTPAISVVSAEWASGALVSTTADLIKLVQGIFESDEHADLTAELLKPAEHPAQQSASLRIESGAGIFTWSEDGRRVSGQFGFTYPFSAQFLYWPDSKTVIAVIANEVDSSRNPNSNFQLPVIENLTSEVKSMIDGL